VSPKVVFCPARFPIFCDRPDFVFWPVVHHIPAGNQPPSPWPVPRNTIPTSRKKGKKKAKASRKVFHFCTDKNRKRFVGKD
jgi:hypothetical protein